MAANQAYIIANQGMFDYLEDTLDVDSQALILSIMRGGFRLPDRLATKKEKFIDSLCNNIRKSGGNLAARNITAEMEEDMNKLRNLCTYRYITQRNLWL